MTTDNFCFYLQNRLIQNSQTGGQWYSDTSPFSIPLWKQGTVTDLLAYLHYLQWKMFYSTGPRRVAVTTRGVEITTRVVFSITFLKERPILTTSPPGIIFISFVTYKWAQEASVFVTSKPFQSSVM
jgi:hypothetical protein